MTSLLSVKGRTLTLTAQYYTQTNDDALLIKHAAKLLGMSDVLLARRADALLLDNRTASFGMIRGQDESDEILVGCVRAPSPFAKKTRKRRWERGDGGGGRGFKGRERARAREILHV